MRRCGRIDEEKDTLIVADLDAEFGFRADPVLRVNETFERVKLTPIPHDVHWIDAAQLPPLMRRDVEYPRGEADDDVVRVGVDATFGCGCAKVAGAIDAVPFVDLHHPA